MRVALLHNSSAGQEEHRDEDLAAVIRRAGHEVGHVVTSVGDLTAALHETPYDLVVVAGGDGTVSRTACELAGWQVPLAILPLGTANNTALSLQPMSGASSIAEGWHGALRVPYDLGVWGDGSVRYRFAEAVGWGVFTSTIIEAKRRARSNGEKHSLGRDREIFRDVAAAAKARPYRIAVDGRDVSGDYLMVEVMNVPYLGPRLALSPSSNPSDGLLELILVPESQRGELQALVDVESRDAGVPLKTERGSHIQIEAGEGVLHHDGRLVRHAVGPRQFEIQVERQAIHYLR